MKEIRLDEKRLRTIVRESIEAALANVARESDKPENTEDDEYGDYPDYDEEMGYGPRLESMVKSAVRKALKRVCD